MRVHTDAESKVAVPPLAQILADLDQQLKCRNDMWAKQLDQDPASFGQVEIEVHQTMQQHADQIVAGLLAQLGSQPSLGDACKKSR